MNIVKVLQMSKKELEETLYNVTYVRRSDYAPMIPIMISYDDENWGSSIMLLDPYKGQTFTSKYDVMFRVRSLHRRFIMYDSKGELIDKIMLKSIANLLDGYAFSYL